MTNVNTASPGLVSISTPPAISGTTNSSHETKCFTNKDHVHENNPSANVASKQMDQSDKKVKDHIPLGCCETFTSLSRGPGDVRHLLAHSPLVKAIQKEVQKEAQTKNPERRLTHSRPDRETDGTPRTGVLNEPFTASLCSTEHCQIIKTTPAYTRASCSNQTSSSCIHPNPSCTSNLHSNPTEPNAPHSYTEEVEEEAERSSSSDDEGKLVIELE